MVVWTLNCVWSDEGICHGGSCSGAEKRRWRWGSDISAMRLCTVFSAAIVNYLDVNFLCLVYSCTQSRQFMQGTFSAQCASVWGGFRQEADPHPSIQPFPILAAAQRGNFKRHVQCTHRTSYWQAFNVSKGCGRRGRHKEKAGWEAIRKEGAVGEEKD